MKGLQTDGTERIRSPTGGFVRPGTKISGHEHWRRHSHHKNIRAQALETEERCSRNTEDGWRR